MRAAWYERQGPAREVFTVGDMPDPAPGPGELRIRIAASGINPGDIRKRQDDFGYGMPYARVIPHSDGAGQVDQVGDGVSSAWLGKSVWCYGAQSYRPFGTAADFTVVPAAQAVPLPANVTAEQGACLGIPGITAHRAVHVAGPVSGRTVLVQGAAGSVGLCAVQLARHAGAHVIGTIRTPAEEQTARQAGAHEVLLNDAELPAHVRALAPEGIDHIVEVAFAANIERDVELLKMGGSIATYATNASPPTIPFWQMVFKNIQLFFLGSDDFPPEAKAAAARDINAALEAGWPRFTIGERIPLSEIARAHELAEHPQHPGTSCGYPLSGLGRREKLFWVTDFVMCDKKNEDELLRHLAGTAKSIAGSAVYSMHPGLYAFFLVKGSLAIGLRVFEANNGKPLYIGKAELSQKARDGQHLSDLASGSSTLRRSLGAILRENLKLDPRPRSDSEKSSRRFTNYKFDPAGENELTAWMRAHLTLAFCELPELTIPALRVCEASLIAFAKPALNIKHNSGGLYKADLEAARKCCADLARRFGSET